MIKFKKIKEQLFRMLETPTRTLVEGLLKQMEEK